MLARYFEVKETDNRGKGIFAKKFIPKGTVVFLECSKCKKIPKEQFEKLGIDEKKKLLEIGYTNSDGTVVVECGIGRYVNHSCTPNLGDTDQFTITTRDIPEGEEITYDYREFYDGLYLTGKAFKCKCNSKKCCKYLRYKLPPKNLLKSSEKRVSSALSNLNKVKQPLKKHLIKMHNTL